MQFISILILALCFQSDFIGKEALQEKAGLYREMSCTMLEVEVEDADPEGNHTIYLCGKVFYACVIDYFQ